MSDQDYHDGGNEFEDTHDRFQFKTTFDHRSDGYKDDFKYEQTWSISGETILYQSKIEQGDAGDVIIEWSKVEDEPYMTSDRQNNSVVIFTGAIIQLTKMMRNLSEFLCSFAFAENHLYWLGFVHGWMLT